MYPMLEPFLYETAREHQSELRESARAAAAPSERDTSPPACLRLRWCSRRDLGTVVPASR
jgi:hypothetical protein